ncbi:MAG TPA: hypothetical protein VH000_04020 [Rhizomicrobium sp.]|nr:hypothetical protein [Rhizomicrobium sp.]HEX4533377.1 hypothetical protein [Rhizomicrobium sp.]
MPLKPCVRREFFISHPLEMSLESSLQGCTENVRDFRELCYFDTLRLFRGLGHFAKIIKAIAPPFGWGLPLAVEGRKTWVGEYYGDLAFGAFRRYGRSARQRLI